MENMFRKDIKYDWIMKCQQAFYTLKEKLVTTPIFIFPNWSKLFHF
jgi:hypothetical protein